MGDVQTAIDSSLKNTKETGSSGGTGQTNVEEAAEGAAGSRNVVNAVFVTVDFGLTTVGVGKVQLGQHLQRKDNHNLCDELSHIEKNLPESSHFPQ